MSFGFVYGRPQGHVNRRGCLSLQSSRLMALSSAKNRRMSPTKDSRYGRWQFYGIAEAWRQDSGHPKDTKLYRRRHGLG